MLQVGNKISQPIRELANKYDLDIKVGAIIGTTKKELQEQISNMGQLNTNLRVSIDTSWIKSQLSMAIKSSFDILESRTNTIKAQAKETARSMQELANLEKSSQGKGKNNSESSLMQQVLNKQKEITREKERTVKKQDGIVARLKEEKEIITDIARITKSINGTSSTNKSGTGNTGSGVTLTDKQIQSINITREKEELKLAAKQKAIAEELESYKEKAAIKLANDKELLAEKLFNAEYMYELKKEDQAKKAAEAAQASALKQQQDEADRLAKEKQTEADRLAKIEDDRKIQVLEKRQQISEKLFSIEDQMARLGSKNPSAAGDIQGVLDSSNKLKQALEAFSVGYQTNSFGKTISTMQASGNFDEIFDYKAIQTAGDKTKAYAETLRQIDSYYTKISQSAKTLRSSITSDNFKLAESKNLSNLAWQIDNYISANKNLTQDTGILSELENIRDAAYNGTEEFSKLSKRFSDVRAEASNLGLETETLAQRFEKLFGAHLGTAITMFGIHELEMMFQGLIDTIIELDARMTQLKIVTGESDRAIIKYADDAAASAKKVAASIASIMQSTEEWSRLGYSLQDSLKLAESTAMYSNVAAISVEDATTSLVSVMKSFNLEAEDSLSILDKLTLVDQKYAISAAELGEGLMLSASTLKEANNSLDQSVALLTAGNTSIQDASKVGNALKTVSMRIRGATAELEAAGEDISDLKTTAKLREEIMGLTGVDILTDTNTFKSTYDILVEIGKVWDDLTDVNRAVVLEDLAGKHNATVVSSIVSNIDELEGAYQTSLSAAGTVTKANEIYLDSLEGKTKQLVAAFQQLVYSDSVNEGAKLTLDLITGILNVANATSDVLGNFPALSVPLAGAAISMATVVKQANDFKSTINGAFKSLENETSFDRIASVFGALGSDQEREALADMLGYNAAMQENIKLEMAKAAVKRELVSLGLQELAVQKPQIVEELAIAKISGEYNEELLKTVLLKNGVAEASIKEATARNANAAAIGKELTLSQAFNKTFSAGALKSTIASFMTSPMGMLTIGTTIITGIMTAKNIYDNAVDEMISKNEELRQSVQELAEAGSELDELGESYERLKNKASLSVAEQEEFLDVQNKLKEIIPTLSGYYDEQGNFILTNVDNMKELNAQYEEYLKNQRLVSVTEYTKNGGWLGVLGSEAGRDFSNYESQAKLLEMIQKAQTKTGSAWMDEIGQENASIVIGEFGYDAAGNSTTDYQTIVNNIQNAIEENRAKFAEMAANALGSTDEWYDLTSEEQDKIRQALYDSQSTTMDQLVDIINSTKDGTTAGFIDSIKLQESPVEATVFDTELVREYIDALYEAKYAKEALASGEISSEDANAAFTAYEEPLERLKEKAKEVGMSIQEYISNAFYVEDYDAENWDTIDGKIDSIQSAFKAAQTAAEEYNQYGYVSLDTLQELISLDSQYLSVLIDKNGQLNLNADTYQKLVNARLQEARAQAISQALNELELITTNGQISADSTAIGIISAKQQALAGLSGQYSAVYESAMTAAQAQALADGYIQAYNRNHVEADRVMSNLNAKLALIDSTAKNATKTYGGLNNAVNGFTKASDSAADAAKDLAQAQVDAAEAALEALEKQQNQLKIYGQAMIDELDDRIDALNKEKETRTEYFEKEIELLEKEKEALQDKYDEEDREFELQQKKDAYAKAQANKTVRVYDENRGFIWKADDSAIADAEEDLNDIIRDNNRDDAIKDIEDHIDALENEKSAMEESIEAQISELEDLKDQYNETMGLIGTSWEDYQLQVQYAAEALAMSFDSMKDNLPEYKDAIIENMQQIAAAEENVESAKAALDALNDSASDATDGIGGLSGGLNSLGDSINILDDLAEKIRYYGEQQKEALDEEEAQQYYEAMMDLVGEYVSTMVNQGEVSDEVLSEQISDIRELAEEYGMSVEDVSDAMISYMESVGVLGEQNSLVYSGMQQDVQDFVDGVVFGAGEANESIAGCLDGVRGFMDYISENTTIYELQGQLEQLKAAFEESLSSESIGTMTGLYQSMCDTIAQYILALQSQGDQQLTTEELIQQFADKYNVTEESIRTSLENQSLAKEEASTRDLATMDTFNAGQSEIALKMAQTNDQMAKSAESSAGRISSAWKSAASDAAAATQSIIDSVEAARKALAQMPSSAAVAQGRKSGTRYFSVSKAYKSGVRAMVDEGGPEILVRSNSPGRFTTLEVGDGVVPHNLTNTLFSAAINPEQFIANKMSNIVGGFRYSRADSGKSNITVEIGDIVLQGVNNVDSFAKEIRQKFGNQLLQEIAKGR